MSSDSHTQERTPARTIRDAQSLPLTFEAQTMRGEIFQVDYETGVPKDTYIQAKTGYTTRLTKLYHVFHYSSDDLDRYLRALLEQYYSVGVRTIAQDSDPLKS